MTSKQEKLYTLIFVINEKEESPKILLGLKKKGFDMGIWNGFGGKVEKNESILEGALRELKEECGLSGKLRRIGVLYFDGREEGTISIVHVFDTYNYSGDITESEEMRPKWFEINDIPFSEMKKDSRIWFDHMLNGNFFKGYFHYEKDKITDYRIEQLTGLEKV